MVLWHCEGITMYCRYERVQSLAVSALPSVLGGSEAQGRGPRARRKRGRETGRV